mmetsp:Transcript_15730/g.31502  ORF Transcript_15730/g.31502 Transcript_15730/m.31502 type:complete len:86 (-) Transcript_15730:232-489(-)
MNTSMSAPIALSLKDSVVHAFAVAIFEATIVICHGVQSQEANQAVKLAHSVLEWCSGQCPAVDADQRKCCICCLRAARFDHVGLI